VLLAARRAFDGPSPRRIVVFAVAVALQILAGSADMCAMTLLIAAADLLSRVDWRRPIAADSRRLAATGLAAVALGAGLSAVLWTTTLDLALRTPRQSLPEAVRTYWSVHPATLLELLYPGLWSRLSLAPALRSALFESREPFLASLYLGVPVLALVAGGIVWRSSRESRFWLAVAVAAILVSLGRHAVFYQLAVLLVPPLRILRYPVKAMVIATFAVTLLAGLGFDAWRGDGTPAARRIRLGLLLPLVLVAVVGLSGAVLLYWDAASWAPRILASVPAGASARELLAPARGPLISASLLAAIGVAIALGRARATRPWPWAAALAALALGDLALYHRNAIPLAPTALYTHRPPVVDGLRELHAGRIYVYDYTQAEPNRRWLGHEAGHLLSTVPKGFGLDPALALSMQQTLAPATAGRWDLESGFEIDYRGLQPDYLGLLSTAIRQLGPEAQLRLLRVGAVTHVVALHSGGFDALAPGPAWDTLLAERVRVFSVPEPLARARVVAGARVADGVAGLATIVDPGFDPTREVLLPEGVPAQPSPEPPGSVRISEQRADRIVLEAELQDPGYVVLADAFDPGWRATLDGTAVPLLRANLGFRAVSAPAGRHRVEMVYRPRALWLGLAVSVTALLTALLLLLRPRR
jgi:hypothetical protein